MTDSTDPMAVAYASLAGRAWRSNRGRAAELAAMVEEWRRAGPPSTERWERMRELAHSLRGSTGTFGHDAAADAAEELEELLIDDARPQLGVVVDLVTQIEQALTEPPDLTG